MNIKTLLIPLLFFGSSLAHAKKVKVRKVQEINFSASSINGKIRNPDGAFLIQKKAVRFLPLHHIRNRFDRQISESIHHIGRQK